MRYILSIIAIFGFLFSTAQDIFSVSRIANNKTGTIEHLPLQGKQLIDLNSNLTIKLDLESIQKRASKFGRTSSDSLLLAQSLKKLTNILRYQKEIVAATHQAISENTVLSKKGWEMMDEILNDVLSDSAMTERVIEISEDFDNCCLDDDDANMTLYLFEQLEEDRKSLQAKINGLTKNANLMFSLSAYRLDKRGGGPVHIENFDSIVNGQIFEVERWVTTFSQEEVELFSNYKQQSLDLHNQIGTLQETYKNRLKDHLEPLKCIGIIPEQIENAANRFTGSVRDNLLAYKEEQLGNLIILRDDINEDLIDWIPGQNLDLYDRVENLIRNAKTAFNALKDQTLTGALNDPDILAAQSCIDVVIERMETTEAFIKKVSSIDIPKVYLDSEDITEDIIAFQLDEIPSHGYINLIENGGMRAIGDELKIKAVLRFPPSNKGKNQRPAETIKQQYFKMYLLGAHSITKVGLVLAQPQNYTLTDTTSNFRFAPNASLLLKFGSKRSIFYNQFVDFGIGVNVAMPDFSGDGVPEFTAGGTLTAFKDILSVGYNYNFGVNDWMWFVGIHLPFNFPGMPLQGANSFGNGDTGF